MNGPARQAPLEPPLAQGPIADAPTVQLQPAEVIALGCIFVGWFGMNTLVTEVGSLQQNFHFYNVWTVLRDPARLATGLTGGDRAASIAFGVVCFATLAAVLLPLRIRQRRAWLTFIAPLVLMILCAGILHHATSEDLLADDGRLGSTGSHLIQFANSLVNHASEAFARHISIGLGAYLSFLASLFLAWKGLTRYFR